MPFTLSHTAAVLPLKKLWPRWFSLTGLMSGAMSPDLQYFLLGDTSYRGISHSWTGLFLYCLPMGLVFAFAFHWLFKKPFLTNLPRPFDRYFSGLAKSSFRLTTARAWVVIVSSILIGAVSHFAWDSFTHYNGVVAQQFDWLLQKVELFGVARHMTRWVQHLSSWVGIVILAWGIWRWNLLPEPTPDFKQVDRKRKLQFWVWSGIAGLIGALAAISFNSYLYGWRVLSGENLGFAFQSLGLGSWAGFFWCCCGLTMWRSFRPKQV